MVRRASGGAEHAHLFIDEAAQTLRVEQRFGFLKQITFIGRAAALGYEHQLVGLAFFGENFDLRRQVGAGILFLKHVEGGHLTVAQIGLGKSRGNTAGQRRLVIAVGPDGIALFSHDDSGAGILAHRQGAAGGNIGIFKQFERHEAIVVRGFGIVQDRPQLFQMTGTQ